MSLSTLRKKMDHRDAGICADSIKRPQRKWGSVKLAVIEYMRGAGQNGGVIALDLVEDLDMGPRRASAWLAQLTRDGIAVRIDRQSSSSSIPFTVYVLADEAAQYLQRN